MKKNKKLNKKESLIIIVSILFGLMFLLINFYGDDIEMNKLPLSELLNKSIMWYYTWSSRTLIQIVWFLILKAGIYVYSLVMALLMYINIKSLYILIKKDDTETNIYLIIAIISSLLLPFYSLCTAGWISTSINYFMPQALALLSLIPIKYYLEDKKTKASLLIVCLPALIMAGFSELTSVILFMFYFVTFCYSIKKKKFNKTIIIFMLIALFFVVFALTCPGNYIRKETEIARWFPLFNELSLLDKIFLGTLNTFCWLYGSSGSIINSLILYIVFVMYILIFAKYKKAHIRLPILIAFSIVVLISVLKLLSKMIGFETSLIFLYQEISTNGYYNGLTYLNIIQFIVYLVLTVIFIINLIILCKSKKELIIDLTIIITGFGSSAILGLSPTVFASATRVFFPFAMCLVLYLSILLSRYILILKNIKVNKIILVSGAMFSIINISYLLCLILMID